MPTLALRWLLSIGLMVVPATSWAQGLSLGVSSSQSLYHPGEQLEISIAAANVSQAGIADFYAGLILPDGQTVATIGASGAVGVAPLATPARFVPIAAGIGLGNTFRVSVDPFFRYAWNGSEPLGNYTIFLVAVRAGGFADNRIDAGDVLALRTGGLHVAARPQLQPGGAAVSALITPDAGGTLALATLTGSLTLAVPPGAVAHDTTITATPIASALGLPLDRLIGAVRFSPDGLTLGAPATLTMALPPSLLPLGTVAFTMKDDGTGFHTVPVTLGNGVASLQAAHFSTAGFGQSVCGPTVTTAVGRDACREMAERLAEAAAIIGAGPGGTPLPVRVLLASELIAELTDWLTRGIRPLIEGNPADDTATAHYFFFVGLRELDAVKAILELVVALDIGPSLGPPVSTIEDLIPPAILSLRERENASCLADKVHYEAWLKRLFDLAAESRQRSLPVSADTHGIGCVVLNAAHNLPAIVGAAGADFGVLAQVRFADGDFLPNPVLVTIEAVSNGLARLSAPTFAQGFHDASLDSHVAPPLGAESLRFTLRVEAPTLGLSGTQVVSRGHSVTVTSRSVSYDRILRTGGSAADLHLTDPSLLDVAAAELNPDHGFIVAGVDPSRVEVTAVSGQPAWTGEGQSGADAVSERPGMLARADVTLSTRTAASLVGAFTCEIEVSEHHFTLGATASSTFSMRLSRNGVAIFTASNSLTRSLPCDEGSYDLAVDMRVAAQDAVEESNAATGGYAFDIRFIPVIQP